MDEALGIEIPFNAICFLIETTSILFVCAYTIGCIIYSVIDDIQYFKWASEKKNRKKQSNVY